MIKTHTNADTPLREVYLHTGSNIGDKAAVLLKAIELIEQKVGRLIQSSALYQTAAWGLTNQEDFYNQALLVETNLAPLALLDKVKEIERRLGRVPAKRWTARIIDIDILFWGNEIIDLSNLTIPHPHIPRRNFVLVPLMEIAPNFVHPIIGKTVEEMYFDSKDSLTVTRIDLETKKHK